jgi:hypothetical protein
VQRILQAEHLDRVAEAVDQVFVCRKQKLNQHQQEGRLDLNHGWWDVFDGPAMNRLQVADDMLDSFRRYFDLLIALVAIDYVADIHEDHQATRLHKQNLLVAMMQAPYIRKVGDYNYSRMVSHV